VTFRYGFMLFNHCDSILNLTAMTTLDFSTSKQVSSSIATRLQWSCSLLAFQCECPRHVSCFVFDRKSTLVLYSIPIPPLTHAIRDSVYYGTEQAFAGGNDPLNRESLFPNFNRNASLYLFIQKAIAVRRRSNASLASQLELLVTDSVYAFSRGQVVVIVTNSDTQHSVQLPVSPFAVGDSVCNAMKEPPQCATVSSGGYSLAISGEPQVMMRASNF
jgi:hypothetical protein